MRSDRPGAAGNSGEGEEMSAVPFSWMYQDPALIADRLRGVRVRMEAEDLRLKELDRRRKARRIRKLTKLAKAGALKGAGNGW